MGAWSAKEIGYLEDHFIESVTENWRYFRFVNFDQLIKNVDVEKFLFAQN